MNKKTWLAIAVVSVAITSLLVGTAFSAELDLTLSSKTGFSRTDFGTGTYTAYTMVWAGDVLNGATKIGDFTATLTKTTYTGENGYAINYDIMVPGGGPLAEFVSVRTNHIVSGAGSDKGVIYAASPVLKDLIGVPVTMDGDTMRITY